LPNSGLRAFGGVNFSSSPELRELPTFGATQLFIRAVVLCRYVYCRIGMLPRAAP